MNPRSTDPLRASDPTELGGYRLLGRLGQGGMGAVYLGRGANGRLVAVKIIRPEHASDPEFRGRFRSEVNRARQVPHFCTAEVLDADPDHPTPYLVVEYVDGPSLAQVITGRGPLSGGDLQSVAIGVATALAAIHGAGVIHRDLKPANVLLALGSPKVIDFGIAQAFEITSQHSRTDQMVGTVAYMAPERFDTGHPTRAKVNSAADVFAWGVVVTYAGTGRTPFQADSPAATAARIRTQPPDLTGLPAALDHIVARTLAKDPRERPTAHELLNLLLDTDSSDKTQVVGAEVLRSAGAAQRTPSRSPVPRWVVAVVATVAVGSSGLLITHFLESPRANARPSSVAQRSQMQTPTPSRHSVVPRKSIVDTLDRPGYWKPSRTEDGQCKFTHHRLEVTADISNWFICRGPTNAIAGDQSVAVDVSLLSREACAYIWFRKVADSGHLIEVCDTQIVSSLDTPTSASGEVSAQIPQTDLGHSRRVEITIRGSKGTVRVNGTPRLTITVDEPSLIAGRVELGTYNESDHNDVGVAFASIAIQGV